MMKNCLLTMIVFMLCFHGISQTVSAEKSKLEELSGKSGILIEKEFVTIGKLTPKVELQVITIKDLSNATEIKGLKINYEHTGKYSTDTKSAFLDSDEIDGLITSIKILKPKLSTVPKNYTEVTFKSRSGFSSGCFYSNEKWSAYLKVEEFDADSYVFITTTQLDDFLLLLESAQRMIKG